MAVLIVANGQGFSPWLPIYDHAPTTISAAIRGVIATPASGGAGAAGGIERGPAGGGGRGGGGGGAPRGRGGGPRVGDARRQLREAEVEQLGRGGRGHDHVRRRHVAMHQLERPPVVVRERVRIVERRRHLARHEARRARVERRLSPPERRAQ